MKFFGTENFSLALDSISNSSKFDVSISDESWGINGAWATMEASHDYIASKTSKL